MARMGADKITSKPPSDGKKIINIFINKDGKVEIEYEVKEA